MRIEAILACALIVAAAASFAWDAYDLVRTGGTRSVSEFIRTSFLNVPAGIAIGLLVASHFVRWPWK